MIEYPYISCDCTDETLDTCTTQDRLPTRPWQDPTAVRRMEHLHTHQPAHHQPDWPPSPLRLAAWWIVRRYNDKPCRLDGLGQITNIGQATDHSIDLQSNYALVAMALSKAAFGTLTIDQNPSCVSVLADAATNPNTAQPWKPAGTCPSNTPAPTGAGQ